MVVLEHNLLDEMIAYSRNMEYDSVLVAQTFKYFQPCITSEWQLEELDFLDDDILKQLEVNPLINRIEENLNSFEELIKKSHLKLILVTSIDKSKTFKQVNVTDNRIKTIFSQTYKKNETREDIKNHIRDLLADKTKITIKDKYFFKNWSDNSKILKDILPINATLEVFVNFNEMGIYANSAQNELKRLLPTMNIEDIKEYESHKFHDRYILADDLEIILSSGLASIENRKKDLTYIVRVGS